MRCKPTPWHSITEAIAFSGEGEPRRAGAPMGWSGSGAGSPWQWWHRLASLCSPQSGCAVVGAGAEPPPQVKVGEEEDAAVTQTH